MTNTSFSTRNLFSERIGKTIFIDENGEYKIFSIGHRTPQGLTSFKNNIISTEHGPMEVTKLTK